MFYFPIIKPNYLKPKIFHTQFNVNEVAIGFAPMLSLAINKNTCIHFPDMVRLASVSKDDIEEVKNNARNEL